MHALQTNWQLEQQQCPFLLHDIIIIIIVIIIVIVKEKETFASSVKIKIYEATQFLLKQTPSPHMHPCSKIRTSIIGLDWKSRTSMARVDRSLPFKGVRPKTQYNDTTPLRRTFFRLPSTVDHFWIDRLEHGKHLLLLLWWWWFFQYYTTTPVVSAIEGWDCLAGWAIS